MVSVKVYVVAHNLNMKFPGTQQIWTFLNAIHTQFTPGETENE